MNEILKNYVCSTPFVYLEAHKNGVFSCCPSWLPNKLSSLEDIDKVWQSEELKKVQDSMLDGSYKFCSKTECPYLSELLNTNKKPINFIRKDEFIEEFYKKGPTNINFAFDRSCNLSCPSCRNVAIMADGKELEFIDNTIDKIVSVYGSNIKLLYLSGSADPFASKSLRKLLLNFDRKKFPNLNHIHLHTNGLLLNRKMWEDLSNIHDLIKTIEISVDASDQKTYEILRRGGDWNILIENLKFISELKLKDKRVSFVVQNKNYKEMIKFYELMMQIFNKEVDVYFNKITNWGTFTDSEYFENQIWNEKHKNFNEFLFELKKIHKKYRCIHNMHDIIAKHISQKNTNLI